MRKFIFLAFILISSIAYTGESTGTIFDLIPSGNMEHEKLQLLKRYVSAKEEANRLKEIEIKLNYLKD